MHVLNCGGQVSGADHPGYPSTTCVTLRVEQSGQAACLMRPSAQPRTPVPHPWQCSRLIQQVQLVQQGHCHMVRQEPDAAVLCSLGEGSPQLASISPGACPLQHRRHCHQCKTDVAESLGSGGQQLDWCWHPEEFLCELQSSAVSRTQ